VATLSFNSNGSTGCAGDDVLEIVEARYDRGATVFCSQFQVEGWYEKIGDATFVDMGRYSVLS